MGSLFISFDPHTSIMSNLNWVSSLLILLLIPSSFWSVPSQIKISFTNLMNFVISEFSAMLVLSKSPLGSIFIPVGLFSFILLTNMSGLMPYIFPSSSHVPFAVSMALPLWLGHMMNAWVVVFNSMMAHLVPVGTPVALMPFMVLIELVSTIIRPLTLSIRLVANIVAGHLLMTLIGSSASPLALVLTAVVMLCMLMLCFLESGVSLVQAYVFSALSTLYLSEVSNSVKSCY